MSNTLFVGNDMIVSFTGAGKLVDENGNAVTGATVKMILYKYGTTTEVCGETWPVVLTDDNYGEYSATLKGTVEIIEGANYGLKITAAGGGAQAEWVQKMVARVRTFRD